MANDTDLELGHLTVEVARGQALTQQLDAVHLGFGAASAGLCCTNRPLPGVPLSPDRLILRVL